MPRATELSIVAAEVLESAAVVGEPLNGESDALHVGRAREIGGNLFELTANLEGDLGSFQTPGALLPHFGHD